MELNPNRHNNNNNNNINNFNNINHRLEIQSNEMKVKYPRNE